MYQDTSGRWVSDDGRYLWDGARWLDLAATEEPRSAAAGQATAEPGAASGAQGQGVQDQGVQDQGAQDQGAPQPRSWRRLPLLLGLVGLLLLAGAGVGAVLLAHSSPRSAEPASAPAAPAPGPTPVTSSPAPGTAEVLDAAARRTRARQALLHPADLPGATEERSSTPPDVFLPCRAAALPVSAETVLQGQTVSNSSLSTSAVQTVAAYPTVAQAQMAIAVVRQVIAHCQDYDFAYSGSTRVDRVTHTDVDLGRAAADGVYLTEVDTPTNYSATPTTYSYGYVRRGQFMLRVTLTVNAQADRNRARQLLDTAGDRLGVG